jgi:hypothetical protein
VSTGKFGSRAASEHWVYIPALALIAFIWFLLLQRARARRPALA